VVGGFYLRARIELRRTLQNLPGKIGIDIQQSSEGFTLSKSEGGRTLFTVHASKATQFKLGGRAELHDVRIVVYGRRSDRFDQIYGSDFEYDPASATVSSRGEVQIDLESRDQAKETAPLKAKEGLQGGTPHSPKGGADVGHHTKAGAQSGEKAGDPTIHLFAEGLVFDQKTGTAECRGRVEFRLPQAAGRARGAVYDSKRNELTLHSEIDMQTEGREPEHIVAQSGSITREPRELTLDGAEISGGGRKLAADKAVAYLAADNSVQRVEAEGNVRLSDAGGLRLRAPKGEWLLGSNNASNHASKGGARNVLQSAWFGGGVDFESGAQAADGHSGEMRMLFGTQPAKPGKTGRGNGAGAGAAELRSIHASRGVVLRQAPREGSRNPQALTLTSEAMNFAMEQGGAGGEAHPTAMRLGSAQTEGPGELTIQSAEAKTAEAKIGEAKPRRAGEQTVIDARQFTADFGEEGRLRMLHGKGAVQVVSRAAGEPDKVSTSETLEAEFSPAGELTRAVQEGNFRYREGQSSKNEPGGRTATAARASYSPLDDTLTLTANQAGSPPGEPRIVDGGTTIEAENIRLLQRSGETFATGNVKTTYSQLAVQPNGALLATSEPIHVTAHAMNARRNGTEPSGLAHYAGGARLWQGSNVVEAQSIDFDAQARTIAATGDDRHPVTSVFLQGDGKGKSSTMLVTAPRLNYEDNQRQAHYTGGVTAKGADGVMTAGRADIILNPAAARGASPKAVSQNVPSPNIVPGPSQLERIVASTRVVVQQGARRVEGEKLVYEASTGTYVMTGGNPMLSDAVNGTVRGDSLTFYSRDDRVVVEGGDSSRAVTHTHVPH
jgi:lipopolysaccharide export system protein LptA